MRYFYCFFAIDEVVTKLTLELVLRPVKYSRAEARGVSINGQADGPVDGGTAHPRR